MTSFNPRGMFIVFGDDAEPIVRVLTEGEISLFYDRTSVANMTAAVAATFGKAYRTALPAWSNECLRDIAARYTGAHELQLRALCAAILLGMPFQELAEGKIPTPAQAASGKGRAAAVPNPTPAPRKPAPAAA